MRNTSRKFPSSPLCEKFKPGIYLSACRDTHTLENKNNLCAVIKSSVIISSESQDWQQMKVSIFIGTSTRNKRGGLHIIVAANQTT